MVTLINPDKGMRFAYRLTSGPDDGFSPSSARAREEAIVI
jgi:hypothetical protein